MAPQPLLPPIYSPSYYFICILNLKIILYIFTITIRGVENFDNFFTLLLFFLFITFNLLYILFYLQLN